MTMCVVSKGQEIKFESSLSDVAAVAILRAHGKGDFATSLVNQWDSRGLSQRQIAWVHRIATTLMNPTPAPVADVGNLSGVVALFDKAGAKLKYPKITFSHNGQTFQLVRAGNRSAHAGSVNVTDGGRFGKNVWYGRINRDGTVTSSRNWTPAVELLLRGMQEDPAGFAAAKGKQSGNCIFCRKSLTDPRSVEVGYGQTCAGHYGLPW